MKKVGIMGGTFNPVHYAHLTLAEMAYEQFGLDEVIFLPSKKPAHKPVDDLAEDEHRLAMVYAATADNPHFMVSSIEYEREGNTYTVDTLELLKKENPETEYYFILGADSLFMLEHWKQPEKILSLCHIIAAIRMEYDSAAVKEKAEFLNKKYHSDIRIVSIPGIDISSSAIRERIRKKQSIRYLLPDSVISYIEQHGLYVI